jgi:hypothetical protein
MARHRLRYTQGMHYSVGPGALAHRPVHAALIAQCIVIWSDIELQFSLTLGAILNTSSIGAVAVFLSLRNSRAQRDALAAAARAVLTPETLEVFEALLIVHKSLEGERNDLAHGLFGSSDSIPDAVLWTPLDEHARWLTSVYQSEYSGQYQSDPHEGLRKSLFYYREKDLRGLLDRLTELQRAAFLMHGFLQPRTPAPSGELLHELRALPQIREALNRVDPNRT